MGAAGGGNNAGFDITPTVAGSTVVNEWNFGEDGDLILGAGTNGAAGLQYYITVTNSLSVNIDMWGGGTSSGWWYTTYQGSGGPGGGGGHTTADVVLNAGTYTIWVGGGGRGFPTYAGMSGPSATSRADYRSGGCALAWGTEGGGMSGLFKTTTISQSNAMLIAGGGGGGGSSGYGGYGGGGGGASGGNSNGSAQSGYGGSQTAGGAASPYNSATAGSALSGGTSHTLSGYASLGGGGGGYYGGGGGNVGGGGGGSGYIDTSDSDITNEVTTAASWNTPGDNSNSRRTASSGSAGAGGTAGNGHGGRFYMSVN